MLTIKPPLDALAPPWGDPYWCRRRQAIALLAPGPAEVTRAIDTLEHCLAGLPGIVVIENTPYELPRWNNAELFAEIAMDTPHLGALSLDTLVAAARRWHINLSPATALIVAGYHWQRAMVMDIAMDVMAWLSAHAHALAELELARRRLMDMATRYVDDMTTALLHDWVHCLGCTLGKDALPVLERFAGDAAGDPTLAELLDLFRRRGGQQRA